MPYIELLNRLISESGLTIKEVAEKCKESGQDITASYISMIRNSENKKIPSDDVSRALAKACKTKNEESLVIEGYIDKAPIEMISFFEKIRNLILNSDISIFREPLSIEEINIIKENFKKIPISDLIIELKNQDVNLNKLNSKVNASAISEEKINMLMELKQPKGLEVTDDSMFPIIPKGSKVVSEIKGMNEYKDGDILVVIVKENKKLIIRKCIFNNKKRTKITLYGLVQEFQPVTFGLDEVSILGKVKTIIKEVE